MSRARDLTDGAGGRILPAVTDAPATEKPPTRPSSSPEGRRRRLPGQHEQARREAWGHEWGEVGARYKRDRLARERRYQ